jgi:hypothetical protein
MELHVVGGAQGQGGGPGHDRDRPIALTEELAEAARTIAGARQRLEALADRLADLRRRLGEAAGSGQGGQGGGGDGGQQ